jgi:GTP-binding protein Era
MLEAALRTVAGSDVVLLLLDATQPAELPEGEALAMLTRRVADLFVAINKIDAAASESVRVLEGWSSAALGKRAHAVSALTGVGVDALRDALVAALPANPFFYPEDELAVQPVRFFAAELVRETIFEEYGQEIPYATVVRIEEFREAADPVYIRATVYVERESQKPIIIGRGGAAIRRLGERAREKIESFLGTRVYLDLWVKALPGWRKKPAALKYLGYPVPPDEGPAERAKVRDQD